MAKVRRDMSDRRKAEARLDTLEGYLDDMEGGGDGCFLGSCNVEGNRAWLEQRVEDARELLDDADDDTIEDVNDQLADWVRTVKTMRHSDAMVEHHKRRAGEK